MSQQSQYKSDVGYRFLLNEGSSSGDDFCADFNDCFQSKLKASGTTASLKMTVISFTVVYVQETTDGVFLSLDRKNSSTWSDVSCRL